ncbi:general substrate transporter [Halteromyces radiatus]|uniref:general substrate transporter n=1 Tax=Halteromyces radiatus TaxID=101107 RepID=UPI002220AB79|nr:general substrate transporter [Halteromyces radiatus]KAI8080044.1 general substrate transporter [Halteromyces radiatus]
MTLFRGNLFLYCVACFASIGQFLFGYDQGVLSGILVNESWLTEFNHPNDTIQGMVVSVFLLGAWVTSYPASWVMDQFGRRSTIFSGAIVFIIGGVLQTAAINMPMLMIGRILSGFGIGFLSTVLPVYTAELSRAHNRGTVTVMGMAINMFGYLCSCFVDYGASYIDSEWSWRLPLLLQCVFAVILALGTYLLPESPRYLINKDNHKAALKVLTDMYDETADHPDVQDEYNGITSAVHYERTMGTPTWMEMFTTYRKRSFIGIAVQALGQLCGINIVTYYAPKMYERVLGPGRASILFSGFTALAYFGGAIVSTLLVDRVGRRPLFMTGNFFMVIWLVIMAVFNKVSLGETSAILVIAFTMIYVATFGASWACTDWLYPAELFPLRARAKGMSLAVGSNWISNFCIGLWTPPMLASIGFGTYVFYAAFNVVAFFTVYCFFVETKGKSLEEIDALFGDINHAHVEDILGPSKTAINSFNDDDRNEKKELSV